MEFLSQAAAARAASVELVTLTRAAKDKALHAMADALAAAEPELLEANAVDVAARLPVLVCFPESLAPQASGLREKPLPDC